MSVVGVFQCGCAIDEKHSSIDALAVFRQTRPSHTVRPRRSELRMESFVRYWVDGCVQPILLVVESDCGSIDSGVAPTASSVGP